MMELGYIIMAALIIAAFGVIIYDRYKYHSYYSRPLVILRVNNVEIRRYIEKAGFPLCWCTNYLSSDYLIFENGFVICGNKRDLDNILLNVNKRKIKVIDCGVSVKRFIYEIQNLEK